MHIQIQMSNYCIWISYLNFVLSTNMFGQFNPWKSFKCLVKSLWPDYFTICIFHIPMFEVHICKEQVIAIHAISSYKKLNGSVSYIFLNFGWFSFLIFPISYGLRFLNFSDIFFKSANASLFQKNLNVFLY